MSNIMIQLGWALMSKLLTETFLSKALVYSLRSIAESTSNKLDDDMVRAVADALGVK